MDLPAFVSRICYNLLGHFCFLEYLSCYALPQSLLELEFFYWYITKSTLCFLASCVNKLKYIGQVMNTDATVQGIVK